MSGAVLDREGILALVPHEGAMCLWDEVVSWNDGRIALRACNHADPAHPLRDGSGLRGLHLCEYGAQAMAVHGGLRAQAAGGRAAPGLLVALRDVGVHRARIDDLAGPLDGEAELLVDGEGGWQYAFRITHAGELLAEGRAAVMPARREGETA